MAKRGHEPAQGGAPQSIKVPQLKQMTPTPGGPSVEQSPARVRNRGHEAPVARPDGVTGPSGSRPTGVVAEPSPARVRGRGSDQPQV